MNISQLTPYYNATYRGLDTAYPIRSAVGLLPSSLPCRLLPPSHYGYESAGSRITPSVAAAVAHRCSGILRHLSVLPPSSGGLLLLLRSVHAHLLASGLRPRAHLLNRLLHLYAAFRDLPSALLLFRSSPFAAGDVVARTTLLHALAASSHLDSALQLLHSSPPAIRDTVLLNAAISVLARASRPAVALSLFSSMPSGQPPDRYSFTSALAAAADLRPPAPRLCAQLHCAAAKRGVDAAVPVSNALLALYSRCALPGPARQVFDEMPQRDELTWATMVAADVRCGDLPAARRLLDDAPRASPSAWNAMISGYAHNACFSDALSLFRLMCSHGIPPDQFTYTSILGACANASWLMLGRSVHGRLVLDPEAKLTLLLENALVTMYSKCKQTVDAMNVFRGIHEKDIVSWNAMLSGYMNSGSMQDAREFFASIPRKNLLTWFMMVSCLAQSGHGEEALKLFTRMRDEGFEPCDYTFAGALTACSVLGALGIGRQLHGLILRFGYDCSNSAGNALVTKYARCGMVQEAHQVFLVMPVLDFVSWNAMIAALAQHGYGHEAIELFKEMVEEGIKPDRITFLTILSACNHAGLVDQGIAYFESMQPLYNVAPGEDHYARFIDLLGRAGRIAEAREVISSMPFRPGSLIWDAVLSGCRIHDDLDLGVYAAEQLFELTPQHDGTYILLSNMYASAGKWANAARIRKLMKDRQVRKQPGCSWIEITSKVHVFLANDTNHPDGREIYRFLEIIGAKMRKLGYVPDTKFVLQDMELEHKEHALSTHSEKLAVAFDLLKLPAMATVRVLKNLRICGDCHTAITFMSLAARREIVIRDGKRFHHFRDGSCSCGNYW